MERFQNILLVGCGNMAGAMLEGWLKGGIAASRFTIVDPKRTEAPEGVTLLGELPREGRFDVVMLGIKPQGLDEAAPAIAALVGRETTLFSILAGVEFESLAARFPAAGAVVRIMPNLAAAIGKSPIALDSRGLDETGRAAVTAMMAHLGTPEWLAEEALFDSVTALAGCGRGHHQRAAELRAVHLAEAAIEAFHAEPLDRLGEALADQIGPHAFARHAFAEIAIVFLAAAHIFHAIQDALSPVWKMSVQPLMKQWVDFPRHA